MKSQLVSTGDPLPRQNGVTLVLTENFVVLSILFCTCTLAVSRSIKTAQHTITAKLEDQITHIHTHLLQML